MGIVLGPILFITGLVSFWCAVDVFRYGHKVVDALCLVAFIIAGIISVIMGPYMFVHDWRIIYGLA